MNRVLESDASKISGKSICHTEKYPFKLTTEEHAHEIYGQPKRCLTGYL